MKLEEYLGKLKACPDDKALAELGISDNWGMLLRASFADVLTWFNQSEMYKFLEAREGEDRGAELHRFNYVPGTVWLQVSNELRGDCISALRLIRDADENIVPNVHYKKQIKNYNMSIIMHPYQGMEDSNPKIPPIPGEKMKGITDNRAIALVIDDICRFAIDTSTPICLSTRNGSETYSEGNSKIIYFPREPEINENIKDKTERT